MRSPGRPVPVRRDLSARRPARQLLVASALAAATLVVLLPGAAAAEFAQPPPRAGDEPEHAAALEAPPAPRPILVRPRPEPRWRSLWRPTVALELGTQLGAGRDLVGLELSAGAVAAGQLYLELRLATLFDTTRHPAGVPYLEHAEDRIQIGAEVGYRLRVGRVGRLPVYLVPRFGMAAALDVTKTHRGLVGPGGELFTRRDRRYRWSPLPVFGGGLLIGNLELIYRYQLDAADRRRSTHSANLGLRF